jgi:dipeptidyl aminopeptidase/acylaminoacyl peptidase
MKKTLFFLILALTYWAPSGHAQQTMTPEILWSLRRVSGPTVSPDGGSFVFGLREYDIAANSGSTDLYLMSVSGGEPARITDMPGTEYNVLWRPDGEKIGFLSASSGSVQLWEMNPDGSDLKRISDIEGGIDNFSYSPDGTRVAFTRDIKLDPTPNEIYPDLPSANARIIDALNYRHWDTWHDYTYRHLHIATYRNGSIGEPIDIMPGERFDTPLKPFGGGEQIAWTPTGNGIAYSCKKKSGTEYAVSTNSDVYLYDISSGETTNLTEGMMGYDLEPAFSPDGSLLSWLSMERDGYEADRNRLFVMDLQTRHSRELTAGFDQDASGATWAPDGQSLFFTSDVKGTIQIYELDIAAKTVRQVTEGVHDYGAFGIVGEDSEVALIASRVSMSAPADIYRVDPENGSATQLTHANTDILNSLELGEVRERWTPTTDGKQLHSWVIYPPDFDPNRQYPALLYCKGGPQGPLSQSFSYRWNFQIMAANGYVVVAPNRRGSSSFGQDWEEEISGDWGGQATADLLSAIDDVAREPYVDENRLGAVGASFGGFATFWLAGNHNGRFKAFIAHDGVFNFESMYGHTEEMFFVNFDFGGPYWKNSKSYDLYSPHRYVDNWDTPILIVQGGRDFRVPESEAMQAFTAAQLKGVPSRLLYFPEENHWVMSAQNGILWQREFFGWLERWLK